MNTLKLTNETSRQFANCQLVQGDKNMISFFEYFTSSKFLDRAKLCFANISENPTKQLFKKQKEKVEICLELVWVRFDLRPTATQSLWVSRTNHSAADA